VAVPDPVMVCDPERVCVAFEEGVEVCVEVEVWVVVLAAVGLWVCVIVCVAVEGWEGVWDPDCVCDPLCVWLGVPVIAALGVGV